MLLIPLLETARLRVRPFALADLDDAHRLFDVEPAAGAAPPPRDEREAWLRWTVANYEQLGRLSQPPYGDRAVVLRETNELVGAVGLVPCLDAFGQLDALRPPGEPPHRAFTAEVGLFCAVARAHRGRGYAAEAARALVDYAFDTLRLRRLVWTTTRDNLASVRVAEKLGMTIAQNPLPDPPRLQIVGVLSRPDA